ncbi:MAG: hypothetical protein E6Q97_38535 [Desulfurellales bacterium]|nr:MAG: hypothetical protein E6Q97_38535 [Desulfurellales bacterium]
MSLARVVEVAPLRMGVHVRASFQLEHVREPMLKLAPKKRRAYAIVRAQVVAAGKCVRCRKPHDGTRGLCCAKCADKRAQKARIKWGNLG